MDNTLRRGKWTNWILGVTNQSEDFPACFCPCDNDGNILFGMNMIQDTCPGNLLGVVHLDGEDAVKEWVLQNPDWKERYG